MRISTVCVSVGCLSFPHWAPGCVVSYHLHVELARGSGSPGGGRSFGLPERILHGEVIFALSASPTPHEQQKKAEEHDAEERDATHGRGHEDGGQIQRELQENTRAVEPGVVEIRRV